jgi:outer membrane immunogenic protein
MRRFLLAAAIMGAVSGAHAADLPVLRGPLTEGLSSTSVNWQGVYVGGQGGYGTSNMNFAGATQTVAARLLSGLEMESEEQVSSWPIMGKVSEHGTGYGGFVGYNWQWTEAVLGVEANYLHGNFGGSQTGSMSQFFTLNSGYTDSVTYSGTATMAISDMGTARLRAGYAFSSFLPYVFAGAAFGQANISSTANVYGIQVNSSAPPGFQNVPFSLSQTDAQNSHLIYGYSGGLGVDINLVAGLFLRAEWEYIRFTSTIDTSINTVRAGLGYKF